MKVLKLLGIIWHSVFFEFLKLFYFAFQVSYHSLVNFGAQTLMKTQHSALFIVWAIQRGSTAAKICPWNGTRPANSARNCRQTFWAPIVLGLLNRFFEIIRIILDRNQRIDGLGLAEFNLIFRYYALKRIVDFSSMFMLRFAKLAIVIIQILEFKLRFQRSDFVFLLPVYQLFIIQISLQLAVV